MILFETEKLVKNRCIACGIGKENEGAGVVFYRAEKGMCLYQEIDCH